MGPPLWTQTYAPQGTLGWHIIITLSVSLSGFMSGAYLLYCLR